MTDGPVAGSGDGGTVIAVFDMDRTITRHGTFSPFLISACRSRPWRLLYLPLILLHMLRYKLGGLTRKELKERMQALLLGTAGLDQLEDYVGRYIQRLVATGIRPGAVARIAHHKAAGHKLVMATASMDYYAAPIGALLGFDLVVATRSTHDNAGRLAARIEGENCYGAPKLDMLKVALAGDLGAHDPPHIVAYSDHSSDLPMLAWASERGEAVAVNPSSSLRRVAVERGYEIVDWG